MAIYRLETVPVGPDDEILTKIICDEERGRRLICEFNGTVTPEEAQTMVDALNGRPLRQNIGR